MAILTNLSAVDTSSKMPLLPEVWVIVLTFLRNPRPKPLSQPKRSEMRQPHLCQAMLVCRLFYNICQPILYTNIHTDNFYNLMAEIDTPAMQRRLGNTRSLFIEYSDLVHGATYQEIFVNGDSVWFNLGRTVAQMEIHRMLECEREVVCLIQALSAVVTSGSTKVFPLLHSIAVSSIYGVESDLWDMFGAWCVRKNSRIPSTCSEYFDQFLFASKIEHLCVRVQYGPLQIMTLARGNHYTRNYHFEADLSHVPIILGSPIRFISDHRPADSYGDILLSIGIALDQVRSVRHHLPREHSSLPAEIDVYCSTSSNLPSANSNVPYLFNLATSCIPSDSATILTAQSQREIASKAGKELQSLLRASSGVKDIVRFHPSVDIQICAACGSGIQE